MKRAAYLGHDAAPLFEFLSSLPQILALVSKALKPDGPHFANYKGGGAEGRDLYRRYFNYLSREDVTEAYRRSGPWEVQRVTSENVTARHLWKLPGCASLLLRPSVKIAGDQRSPDLRAAPSEKKAVPVAVVWTDLLEFDPAAVSRESLVK